MLFEQPLEARAAPLVVPREPLQAGMTRSPPPLEGRFHLKMTVKMGMTLVGFSAAFKNHKRKKCLFRLVLITLVGG